MGACVCLIYLDLGMLGSGFDIGLFDLIGNRKLYGLYRIERFLIYSVAVFIYYVAHFGPSY